MSEMRETKVYIIVLNYNGWKDTIECLESLLKNSYPNFQIIVVDNNSTNDSMTFIKAWAEGYENIRLTDTNRLRKFSYPPSNKPIPYLYYSKQEALSNSKSTKVNRHDNPIIMIQAGENRGFSAGNNIGIQYAMDKNDAEYVLLLNNDTVVEKNFLFPLLEKHRNDHDFGIIGPKIMHYYHIENIFSNGGSYNPWTSHVSFLNSGEKDTGQNVSEATFLSGCAWFIPIDTFNNIGMLNEKYFMYMEDVDFTQKIRAHGKKLGVASSSKIYHKGTQSSGGGSSEFSVYWIAKNLARYILNNLTTLQKITAISYFFYNETKALVKSILKGKKPKVLVAIKGFLDGVLDRNFLEEKQ